MDLVGPFTCTCRCHRCRRSECQAPVSLADLELINPGASSAGADPQAKSWQVIVEENRLRLLLRKLDRGNRFLGELHGVSSLVFGTPPKGPTWEDHGKIRNALGCPLVPIID